MAVIAGDAGDNDLVGTPDDDTITGEDGDDTLEGGEGSDTLDGGDGFDLVTYQNATSGVNVNLTLGGIGGEADGDVIIDVEDLMGSAFGDILAGNAGGNYLFGGAGGDLIEGQAGDDVIDGGSGEDLLVGGDGSDMLNYGGAVVASDAPYGLVLDFLTGHADIYYSTFFLPDRDTFSGFEGVIGTTHDDWIRGGAGDDTIIGNLGDDVLVGGDGGDFLVGDAGVDTASYFESTGPVDVSLFTGFGSGSDAEGDFLLLIENLVGTAHNDVLEGDMGDNLIVGGAGADVLIGLEGFDTLDYRASATRVFVNLQLSTTAFGDAEGDVISGFEAVIGSARNDRLHGGNGNQTIEGFSGNDQLHGGNGIDTISFAHTPVQIVVNLALGFATGAGNDTISGFENVITSSEGDTIVGDTNDNVLAGMGGADDVDGGDGFDTADYSASDDGVTVNLGTGAATGGHAEGDALTSIEGLVGSDFADVLTGSTGDDRIEGGLGDDVMDGGDGIDTLTYEHSENGVSADLAAGSTCGCGGETDTFTNFENLTGSAFDDDLTGDSGDNVLTGGAGADILDGGGGNDTISYAGSSVRVTVNLISGLGTVGDAQGDQYISIEGVIGTRFNDRIYGGAASETFEGGAGNDVLLGRRGDDTLTGGAGNDRLNGGAGADHFVFGDEAGVDVIDDYSSASGDVIVLGGGVFDDFADVLAHTTDDGLGNCTISKSGVQITLTGVTSGQLVSGGFDIQPAPSMMVFGGGADHFDELRMQLDLDRSDEVSHGRYPAGVIGPAHRVLEVDDIVPAPGGGKDIGGPDTLPQEWIL